MFLYATYIAKRPWGHLFVSTSIHKYLLNKSGTTNYDSS